MLGGAPTSDRLQLASRSPPYTQPGRTMRAGRASWSASPNWPRRHRQFLDSAPVYDSRQTYTRWPGINQQARIVTRRRPGGGRSTVAPSWRQRRHRGIQADLREPSFVLSEAREERHARLLRPDRGCCSRVSCTSARRRRREILKTLRDAVAPGAIGHSPRRRGPRRARCSRRELRRRPRPRSPALARPVATHFGTGSCSSPVVICHCAAGVSGRRRRQPGAVRRLRGGRPQAGDHGIASCFRRRTSAPRARSGTRVAGLGPSRPVSSCRCRRTRSRAFCSRRRCCWRRR